MAKQTETLAVWIAVIVSMVFLFVFVRPKVIDKNRDDIPPKYFIYDTDPDNDQFIQGQLEVHQLKALDAILEIEREKCGLRLPMVELDALAKNDRGLVDAYQRWRKCKDMMRSNHHVIYPSERKRRPSR